MPSWHQRKSPRRLLPAGAGCRGQSCSALLRAGRRRGRPCWWRTAGPWAAGASLMPRLGRVDLQQGGGAGRSARLPPVAADGRWAQVPMYSGSGSGSRLGSMRGGAMSCPAPCAGSPPPAPCLVQPFSRADRSWRAQQGTQQGTQQGAQQGSRPPCPTAPRLSACQTSA